MRANLVSPAVIADAADAIAERIDLLLERATDAVIAAPNPGSPQWREAWETRGSEEGRAALERRMLVKIAIAQRAGIDPCHEIDRARREGVPWIRIAAAAGTSVERVRRRQGTVAGTPRVAEQQLAIW